MAQLLKKVTEVEVREALPPAQFAKLAKTAKVTGQNAEQYWNDGPYEDVVKIVANVKNQELVSIQFNYTRSDGTEIVDPKHGGVDGDVTEFVLDEDEHVIKVTAYYDESTSYFVRLVFYTDKDRNFDTENGVSPGGATGQKKIVGFQGKADANHICDISGYKKAV